MIILSFCPHLPPPLGSYLAWQQTANSAAAAWLLLSHSPALHVHQFTPTQIFALLLGFPAAAI